MKAAADIVWTDWLDCPVSLPDGVQEAAVGDVHGCAGQLRAVLDAIADTHPNAHLTLLGDLVDRGPDSAEALIVGIDAVRSRGPGQATFLPGNHEQLLNWAMLDPLSNGAGLFVMNGGSWLLDAMQVDETPAHAMSRLIGPDRVNSLTQDGALQNNGADAVLHRRSGNLLLVHAGVDPTWQDPEQWIAESPVMATDNDHPLWIREPFLEHRGAYGRDQLFVAHGHTMEYTIERSDGAKAPHGVHRRDGWRLGLDGGSFKTGIVAGAVFEDGRYRVVTATS